MKNVRSDEVLDGNSRQRAVVLGPSHPGQQWPFSLCAVSFVFPSALWGGLLALVTLAKLPGQAICLPKPPCLCSPAPPLHRGKKAPFWLHLCRSSQSSGADLKGQCQNNVTGILVASLGNKARIFDRIYYVLCMQLFFFTSRASIVTTTTTTTRGDYMKNTNP